MNQKQLACTIFNKQFIIAHNKNSSVVAQQRHLANAPLDIEAAWPTIPASPLKVEDLSVKLSYRPSSGVSGLYCNITAVVVVIGTAVVVVVVVAVIVVVVVGGGA